MINNLLHRKETIVFTTIDVINEFGIQSVSTKEIAKRQGISEATIFKHYKTKNDLLIAVLDYYTQYDSDIMITTKEKLDNPYEAIIFFIKAFTQYYENYPAITSINLAFDVMTCDPELGERIKKTFFTRITFIKELLDASIRKGQLRSDVDTDLLADIIWGTSQGICLKWRFQDYQFSLSEHTLSAVKLILDSNQMK